MKFAKELERDIIPEWRIKYFDYKSSKKLIKAIHRARIRLNAIPHPASPTAQAHDHSTLQRSKKSHSQLQDHNIHGTTTNDRHSSKAASNQQFIAALKAHPSTENSVEQPSVQFQEDVHLADVSERNVSPERQILGLFTPVSPTDEMGHHELRDPAPSRTETRDYASMPQLAAYRRGETRSGVARPNAPDNNRVTYLVRFGSFISFQSRFPQDLPPIILRRMFSLGSLAPLESGRADVAISLHHQNMLRETEFFDFMDKELEKVEMFYKAKEDEAITRLVVLREQLHEMRKRRVEELIAKKRYQKLHRGKKNETDPGGPLVSGALGREDKYHPTAYDLLATLLDFIGRNFGKTKHNVTRPYAGANSKAWESIQDSSGVLHKGKAGLRPASYHRRDYVEKPHHADEVPYHTAKTKLKRALQEYYRSMELLKSYAFQNRTAFRKANKKYDKAVDEHHPLGYTSERVNQAWFVRSDVLDKQLFAVEDLYASYFERGQHKVAVGKLRSSGSRRLDQSSKTFKNGILIGLGGVLIILGTINGFELFEFPDVVVRQHITYLLQIYAGYFLALYLLAFFCLNCYIWTRNKINYQFIFEFDSRHTLDWRELAEFPSVFVALLGVFVWLNFNRYGAPEMFIYYPVVLIFITLLIIFFPGPIFLHRSRKWFVYSNWRLLLAGLYPVEFRDFFLGDMYCSLTYFISNIELFFCLYAHLWTDTMQCHSSSSRLLGFFSALPAIWRALQCLRRYYDSREKFPHLVNCGKYLMTICYYMNLSIYRIQQSKLNLVLFIIAACINAIYASIWDLLMDWSLLQPQSTNRLLRDARGYKNDFWYYAAMIIDPILRFNWVLYTIYDNNPEHSSLVAFIVAITEVTRRGIWVFFRVENEHCTNVVRFEASRDTPLPYSMHSDSEQELPAPERASSSSLSYFQQAAAVEAQQAVDDSGLGRASVIRRTSMKTRSMMADAHTKDFEKKRRLTAGFRSLIKGKRNEPEKLNHLEGLSGDDDDDDDELDDSEGISSDDYLDNSKEISDNDNEKNDGDEAQRVVKNCRKLRNAQARPESKVRLGRGPRKESASSADGSNFDADVSKPRLADTSLEPWA